MSRFHPRLRGLLKAHFGQETAPEGLGAFVEDLDEAYRAFEQDRGLLERSLDLSSQELLKTNLDMRAMIQAFPDLFLWISAEGEILGCRARTDDDLFMSADDLVGKNIQNVPCREVGRKFKEAIDAVNAGTELLTMEYSLILQDERKFFEARLITLRQDQHLVIIRNVTDRVQANLKLEQTISLLRSTIEATADGILVVDNEGTIVTSNQKFVELWCVPEDILESKDDNKALEFAIQQLVDPEQFLAKVRELYSQPDAESVDELHFKDGRVFERYSRPHRIGGESVGRVWSFRDVSERREAEKVLLEREEQLQHAQKMDAVGKLAGGIAHDFNNLLTVIVGYAEIILIKLGDREDPVKLHVEEIRKTGKRAAALTRQLLAFSRKQVLAPKVLDLNHVVSNMDKMLKRLIGEHIELTYVAGADLGCVQADPGQLEQVIVNLAVNARDAMESGGKLTIETANAVLEEDYTRRHPGVIPGDYVELRVADTGCGMDSKIMAHIFEPFFTTKEGKKGTGLGLSTVYGIIKQSDGHIAAESRTSEGSMFRVYLPRVESPPEADTRSTVFKLKGTETILLVEDETRVRRLVKEILENSGYTVIEATDGNDAMEVSRGFEGSIHLMLTDVIMPHMNGPVLFQKLCPERPDMKVLYMSGYTDGAIDSHGGLDPDTSFLQKPFTPSEVALRVREALDRAAAA
jgi:PAS domain S-box-containing protein